MSKYNGVLRKKPRISYFEPDEPNTDDYVYCEKCSDFVYEYCSIHGPLLVVPDDKVEKSKSQNIPHAALSVPRVFLHLAPSSIPGAGIGVFATLTLPRGVRFGPYRGTIKHSDYETNDHYSWQIYKGNKPLHIVSGEDTSRSNWMRYVNCARHYQEQNLVAYQYKGNIYYRTITIIPKHTELLVFYGSECAASLQIDLSKFNNNKYYQEIKDATTRPKHVSKMHQTKKSEEMKPENIITTIEIVKDEMLSNKLRAYEILDDFTYIDDDNDFKSNMETKKVDINAQQFDKEFHNENSKNVEQIQTSQNDSDLSNYSNIQAIQFHNENVFNRQQDFANHNYWHTPNCCLKKQYDIRIDENIKKENDFNGMPTVLANISNQWHCNICNKSMNRKNRSYHEKYVHTDVYRFHCHLCHYKSNHKYRFDNHLASHNNNYNFQCHLCSHYVTNTKRNLQSHIKSVHDKEPTPKCDYCNYRTAHKAVMDNHKARHFKINVQKCPKCDYLADTSKGIKNHMATHSVSEAMIFQCMFCSYKTMKKSAFTTHNKYTHRIFNDDSSII